MTDARLLLAATLALLEGWSGPVVVDGRATVARWDNGASSVWVEATPAGNGYWWYWSSADTVSVALDLSRAECRDRVARVVLAAVGKPASSAWQYHRALRGWLAGSGTVSTCHLFSGDDQQTDMCVPALADLDPLDDTRLPDGSRLVDALALALVARHVLGLGVGR